ncbi:MAG: heavy metal-binding domain-containing protein [Methanobacteriaceae archaeon]|nr:heavy metal-binding domain-containing protein [Methanobacteriaceae archaeon]
MDVSVKNYFIEKRWAFTAVILGFLAGFGSAYLCIIWHLVIFGFNIMYIVSPLLAGFVETVIARRKYGRSTGAISALLTFLLINIYGWFLPGTFVDPTKEPATLSFITIIAIVLTIQAAFPILVNYILFVVVMGTLTRIIGFLVNMPSKIMRAKTPITEEKEELTKQADEIFLDELTIPIVSVPDVNGGKIKSYVGLVTGEAVAEEKKSEGRFSSILKIIQPAQLDDFNLGEARKGAISRMLEKTESMGANSVVEVLIDYVSVGGLQGSATIVTATGTAVIVQGTSDLEEKVSKEDSMSGIGEKNVPESGKRFIDEGKSISGADGKKAIVSDTVSTDDLSNEIDPVMNEENDQLIKDLRLATKFDYLEELEKRFSKVSRDLDELEKS